MLLKLITFLTCTILLSALIFFLYPSYFTKLDIEKLPDDIKDYTSWNSYLNKAVTFDPKLCAIPLPKVPFIDNQRAKKGPFHKEQVLSVFVNNICSEFLSNQKTKLREGVFPPGSVIVKEKKASKAAIAHAIGVMFKREAGYDKELGDWEFMYLSDKGVFTRGKENTSACGSCHMGAVKTDFVFGNY